MTLTEIQSLNVSQLRDALRERSIPFVTRDRKGALKAKLIRAVTEARKARRAATRTGKTGAQTTVLKHAIDAALPLAIVATLQPSDLTEPVTVVIPDEPGACTIVGSTVAHRSESWQDQHIRVETPEQRDRRQARNKAKARRRRLRRAA